MALAMSHQVRSGHSEVPASMGFMPIFPPPTQPSLPTLPPPLDPTMDEMYRKFQTWALRNYGDSGKTKTVTRKKYGRILRILTGDEPATTENSKFRFWVKGKAFRLGQAPALGEYRALYVPSKTMAGEEQGERGYKRVAIVEDFFNIIYSVHVEMDGRGGKHAGQKRTYRAIAETYSFLPREAVTRFLMSCSDCQKRMHLTMETNNNSQSADTDEVEVVRDDPPIVDYLPITTAYLNHMRSRQIAPARQRASLPYDHDEDSMSCSSGSSPSTQSSPSIVLDSTVNNISSGAELVEFKTEAARGASEINGCASPMNLHKEAVKRENGTTNANNVNMADRNGMLADGASADDKPLNMSSVLRGPDDKGQGHPERKRRASSDSLDSYQTKASESAADDVSKDDEEENDDDDDEKMSTTADFDPERLKSFNMFVRLFVDENLDRIVPISKQPKDKIQAILDACNRQFPEFHERSRKRIRTYLKSCRRMRRSKDSNGWEQVIPMRPTPPHLTSAAAESLLAQACENESINAKRMRMGLEPIASHNLQPAMIASPAISLQQTTSTNTSISAPSVQTTVAPSPNLSRINNHSPSLGSDKSTPAPTDLARRTPSAPSTAFRPPHELPSPFFTSAASNGIFRPGFPTSYQPPAHAHPPVIQPNPLAAQMQNGPTDLSMKKSALSTPSSKNQLNSTEVATIKQLIAGYRESAAFLYRSADELEQLLLHQN